MIAFRRQSGTRFEFVMKYHGLHVGKTCVSHKLMNCKEDFFRQKTIWFGYWRDITKWPDSLEMWEELCKIEPYSKISSLQKKFTHILHHFTHKLAVDLYDPFLNNHYENRQIYLKNGLKRCHLTWWLKETIPPFHSSNVSDPPHSSLQCWQNELALKCLWLYFTYGVTKWRSLFMSIQDDRYSKSSQLLLKSISISKQDVSGLLHCCHSKKNIILIEQ